ncbi:hypothetical protein CJ030_MR1G003754 [Morella rubra]|uniref:Uncharacterized protein n=1 Tax=Morella rubra TaxID=262757 RepID=A0A6A1WLW0_9ROSI|nr:hypothetical protein CJ030_MR1G003754 [Morella rubra]
MTLSKITGTIWTVEKDVRIGFERYVTQVWSAQKVEIEIKVWNDSRRVSFKFGLLESSTKSSFQRIKRRTIWSFLDEVMVKLLQGVETNLHVTEHRFKGLVEFKWKNLEAGRHETCGANSWFEILAVVYLIAMLTLSEADSLMLPKNHSGSGLWVVPSDCKRDAVDLILKAAGYLDFCVQDILVRIPPDIKKRLPKDLQDVALEAIAIQAVLGQVLITQETSIDIDLDDMLRELKFSSETSIDIDLDDMSVLHQIWKSKLKVIITVVNKILVKIVSIEQRNRICLVRKLCLAV